MPANELFDNREIAPPPSVSNCGTGVILLTDDATGELFAVPTFCHRWDCPHCGPYRQTKARAQAKGGKPERIITLTTRPRPGMDTEQAVRWIRERWQRLLCRLRRRFPRLEYYAVTELHKSGWPHLHILTRGCYIPQRMLSAWWLKLTGSFKVHIQRIHKTWKGIAEATKYLLKTARQFHKAAPTLPVYTMSRKWLPDDWNADDRPQGSRTFFAFCRLGWTAFREILERLGAEANQVDTTGRVFSVSIHGPPDPRTCDLIQSFGTWGAAQLVNALLAWHRFPNCPSPFLARLDDELAYGRSQH